MLITIKKLQEFWNLPEGKQFLSALIIALGLSIGANIYQYNVKVSDNKTLLRSEKDCNEEKLAIERAHARKDSTKDAIYIKKLEDKVAESEEKDRRLNELLERHSEILKLQSKVNKNITTIQKAASK